MPPPKFSRGKRVAFLFRYGVRDHAELYPIIPEVLRRLGEEGEVLYIGLNRRRVSGDFKFPGVQYFHLPVGVNRGSSLDVFWKTILWYFCLPFLSLRCRFWKADYIWIDESIPMGGWIVQLFSGRPTVLTVVDFFLEIYAEKAPWLKGFGRIILWFDRMSWQKAIGISTRAESMRQFLIKEGIDKNKIITIRDAVTPDLFTPVDASSTREKLGFTTEDVVIGQHGILHPNKGLDRVLNWMAPLMKKDSHLKLLVIGTGPGLSELETIVEEQNLHGQVKFTHWLPSHRDVNQYLNACDIGLVMRIGQFSDHFHVTGALIHCMMCALPVLAARLEGICEIVVEGEEGVLFDPSSGDEFVAKLRLLREDSAGRKAMGEKGRLKAKAKFDPQDIANETMAALHAFSAKS